LLDICLQVLRRKRSMVQRTVLQRVTGSRTGLCSHISYYEQKWQWIRLSKVANKRVERSVY